MTEIDAEFAARMSSYDALVIRKNEKDGAFLVRIEGRARCVECGNWLLTGWSYQKRPVDGNYVECADCRYGLGGIL